MLNIMLDPEKNAATITCAGTLPVIAADLGLVARTIYSQLQERSAAEAAGFKQAVLSVMGRPDAPAWKYKAGNRIGCVVDLP